MKFDWNNGLIWISFELDYEGSKIEALNHALTVSGVYKTIKADISLHKEMFAKDFENIIRLNLTNDIPIDSPSKGQLGELWSTEKPQWWINAGVTDI